MFGFGNKSRLTITREDKQWVDTNILWMGEVFGFSKLLESPFLLPTSEQFPYTNLREEVEFDALFCQLCTHLELNRQDIKVFTYKDEVKTWTVGDGKSDAGYYIGSSNAGEKHRIFISENYYDDMERLVSLIAHELMHVKLSKYIHPIRQDNEALTDLGVLFFGFGIMQANSAFRAQMGTLTRVGYLPDEIIAYTNALLCYISGEDSSEFADFLNTNTKKSFESNFSYLQTTGNATLDKIKVEEINKKYALNSLVTDAFRNRNYEQALHGSEQYLQLDPKMSFAWNNLGYAKSMLGDFKNAIKDFDKAIELDCYASYPFDNRAFCKLQYGQLEEAYNDIITSLEFDDTNSYTWRTLGLYYMLKDDIEKALELLLKAYNIDPETDLIHYYLAKCYHLQGDTEKSIFHSLKSSEIKEASNSFWANNKI